MAASQPQPGKSRSQQVPSRAHLCLLSPPSGRGQTWKSTSPSSRQTGFGCPLEAAGRTLLSWSSSLFPARPQRCLHLLGVWVAPELLEIRPGRGGHQTAPWGSRGWLGARWSSRDQQPEGKPPGAGGPGSLRREQGATPGCQEEGDPGPGPRLCSPRLSGLPALLNVPGLNVPAFPSLWGTEDSRGRLAGKATVSPKGPESACLWGPLRFGQGCREGRGRSRMAQAMPGRGEPAAPPEEASEEVRHEGRWEKDDSAICRLLFHFFREL